MEEASAAAATISARISKWEDDDDDGDDQGGRSCTGARVAPAEKFGLGRKF